MSGTSLWSVGQAEGNAQGDAVGGGADEGFVVAGVGDPLGCRLVVAGEGVGLDGEVDQLLLTWLEVDFLEGLELLDGALYLGVLAADVELQGLGSGALAGVPDGNGEGDLATAAELLGGGLQSAQLEGGVAQAVAEGEQWALLLAQTVGPAIAYVDALLVVLVDDLVAGAPRAGIAARGVGTALVERGVSREGKLAAGVDVAGQH